MGKLLLRLSAAVGVAVSLYAVYVEHRIATAEELSLEYDAPCDVGGFSCSRVLTSEYSHPLSALGILPRGHPLDVSNALAGSAWYAVAGTALLPQGVLLALSVGSLAYSAFLLYILKYVLHDACLVCIAMYAANLGIFAATARQVVRRWGGNAARPGGKDKAA